MVEKERHCRSRRPRVEARRRPLHAEDADELAAAVPHGRRDRGRDPPRARPAPPRSPAGVPGRAPSASRSAVGDRPGGEGGQQRRPGGCTRPKASSTLPDRRRVPDARPSELGHALHGGGTVHEVDGDGVVLARRRERRGLSGLAHERLAGAAGRAGAGRGARARRCRARRGAARGGSGRWRARARRTARGERREQAGDGARVDAGAAGDLVRAELAAVGERVEHGERPLDGGDVADGWLSGAGRGTLLLSVFETPLPGRQFT